MNWTWLPVAVIERIHDTVLNPDELPGRVIDKTLERALARVENRVHYGLIGDACDLAATYATAIAQGNCFNDGNKRTAYRTMLTCLRVHEAARPMASPEAIGDRIIALAQGQIDDGDLADWLRDRA